MVRNGNRLGGEQSGHIIFSKYATTGDGILTSLKMMEVVIAKKTTLGKLAAPLKIYPQLLINVRVNDKDAVMNDEDVIAAAAEAERRLSGRGRLLLRESGTEPLIRVMAEAETEEMCRCCAEYVADVIRRKGYEAK